MRNQFIALLASLVAALSSTGAVPAPQPVRVAVLKFGTVNWELDVLRHHRLDAAEGIALEVVELASGQATKVALQAGGVDIIASDWLWVSRVRGAGGDLAFTPYSSSLGELMVPPGSAIADLADLAGKRIGVAGGPLDKSWLIMRALARKQTGLDPASAAEPVFAAPPLLNQKAKQGELDAVLNYWPYCARLEAKGFKRLVGVAEAISALGLKSRTPIVGYVFHRPWAEENEALIAGFLRATDRAREILATSDAEWERIRPLMRAEDDATFASLRRRFRQGIPRAGTKHLPADAERLYRVLAEIGGKDLVGALSAPAPGTFWMSERASN